MAIARICGRCGGVYAKNEGTANFGTNKYGVVKGVCVMFEETDFKRSGSNPDGGEVRKNAYFDLCDKCSNMLVVFMKDARTKIDFNQIDI